MASTGAAAPARPTSLVEVPYRTKLLIVATLTTSMTVVTMNMTVMATSAQSIVADIGGFELFIWLFAAFSLTSSVVVPIVGKLTDIYGGKRVIIISLALFTVSSAVAGAMQTMPQLIAVRAVQGIGSAGVMGSIWIIMAGLWPPAERAKWLGAITAGFTISGVLGPIVGGLIADNASWRWVFWINVPAGGVALALLWYWYPSVMTKAREAKFDFAGAFMMCVAASALLYAVTVGGKTYPWASPQIAGLLVVSAVATLLFIVIERRAADPVLPLHLFRERIFAGGITASLSVTTTFSVVVVFVPLLVQGARGGSATEASFPLMTMAAGVAIGANGAGQILSRFGYAREMAVGGLLVAAAGLAWLANLPVDTPAGLIFTVTLVMGVGMSFAFTTLHIPVQNAMPDELLGVVTSALQFFRTFGMVIGAVGLGAVLLAQLGSYEAEGPAREFADPEVLVSVERLERIEQEFLDDPDLGATAYETELAAARSRMAAPLGTVFWAAGGICVFGAVVAAYAFSGKKREDE